MYNADVFPMHLGQTHVAYFSHVRHVEHTQHITRGAHAPSKTRMIHTYMYVGGKCVLLKDNKCMTNMKLGREVKLCDPMNKVMFKICTQSISWKTTTTTSSNTL